jgi:ATP-dependent Clp protease, protease subunit
VTYRFSFRSHQAQRIEPARTVAIQGPITTEVADRVITGFLLLERESHRDILLRVDSPGGDVKAGMAIYEALRLSKCDIATYSQTGAASMAAVLLAAGAAQKRIAAPRAQFVFHSPRHNPDNTLKGDEHVRQIIMLKALLNEILQSHSGKAIDFIPFTTNEEFRLTAQQAKGFGLIDRVGILRFENQGLQGF